MYDVMPVLEREVSSYKRVGDDFNPIIHRFQEGDLETVLSATKVGADKLEKSVGVYGSLSSAC